MRAGFDPAQFPNRTFVRPPPKAVPWPAPHRTKRSLEAPAKALETLHVVLLVAGAFLDELAPGLPTTYSVIDVAWNAYDALKHPRANIEFDSAQPAIDDLLAHLSRVRKVVNMGTEPGAPERKLLLTKTRLAATRALVTDVAPLVIEGLHKVAASGAFPALTREKIAVVQRAYDAAREAVESAQQTEASNAAERALDADPKQRATDVLLAQYDLIRMAAVLHLDEFPVVSELLSAPVERTKKNAKKGSDEEGEDEGEDGGGEGEVTGGGISIGNGEKGDAKKDAPAEKKK